MHALTVVRTYVKLGALNALQYRVNFVFELAGVAIYLASVLLTLGLIFRQTESLNGWNV